MSNSISETSKGVLETMRLQQIDQKQNSNVSSADCVHFHCLFCKMECGDRWLTSKKFNKYTDMKVFSAQMVLKGWI